MNTHEFTLVIDHALDDDEQDALYDVGCDDTTPEIEAGRTLLHFTREAASQTAAVASAVLDVEKAGSPVGGVGSNDLVDVPEIASRVGRSRESVRLLAAGRRGPGSFPTGRDGFYSWAAVRAWFADYDSDAVGAPDADALAYDRVIAAADHVVRARALMQGHAQGLRELLPT
ncbi:MAG: hypothetical protein L0I76_03265 [Pseudonocardia sp.]|nr:hypothetical protein [Pseudonocardia sp.]